MTIHTTRKGNKHGDEITRATYRAEQARQKKAKKLVQVSNVQAKKIKKVITNEQLESLKTAAKYGI